MGIKKIFDSASAEARDILDVVHEYSYRLQQSKAGKSLENSGFVKEAFWFELGSLIGIAVSIQNHNESALGISTGIFMLSLALDIAMHAPPHKGYIEKQKEKERKEQEKSWKNSHNPFEHYYSKWHENTSPKIP